MACSTVSWILEALPNCSFFLSSFFFFNLYFCFVHCCSPVLTDGKVLKQQLPHGKSKMLAVYIDKAYQRMNVCTSLVTRWQWVLCHPPFLLSWSGLCLPVPSVHWVQKRSHEQQSWRDLLDLVYKAFSIPQTKRSINTTHHARQVFLFNVL